MKWIPFAFLILISCSSKPKMGDMNQSNGDVDSLVLNDGSLKTDTVYYKLGQYKTLDSSLNPYVSTIDTVTVKDCNKFQTREQSFQNIIKQFVAVPTPIELGPIPDPFYLKQKGFEDSIFFVDCLKDSYYYKNEPGDRTCGYMKGKIVDENARYILFLMLYSYDNGFDYQLYSLNHKGELISHVDVGGQGADFYEIYGVIETKRRFRVIHNEYNWNKDKMHLLSSLTSIYEISDDGKFIKK